MPGSFDNSKLVSEIASKGIPALQTNLLPTTERSPNVKRGFAALRIRPVLAFPANRTLSVQHDFAKRVHTCHSFFGAGVISSDGSVKK
jgi:hypothetical protein